MEKLGKADGEEDESDGNDEASDQDSEQENDVEEAKAPAKSQPARTILRAKRKGPAAKAPVKEETKTAARKQPARSKSKKKAAEVESDDENDLAKMVKVEPMTQPEIGKKRKHPASGPFEAEQIPSKRVKRNADGSETVSEAVKPKAKKAPKLPTVFKAGKWNPDTVLVEEETEKCGDSRTADYGCCLVCNMRNLHRAVHNDDVVLLSKLVMDKKNIPHLLS